MRWIPSTLRRDANAAQNVRYDAIFRRVRGLLNKITPEKFEKLCDDILNVGLESPTILKGVILLIFEKALDEPKYTSMYAQLCKRLAENGPNFEPSDKPCTFKKLLLNKCRDEFENRAQLSLQYEKLVVSQLTEDQSYGKLLAKRKMLGNIKFIGELGKLEMLHDSIIHRCCEQLLVGRKKQPIPDQAEDLECLVHLMRTCGRLLDNPKSKPLMDQYFVRLKQVTENEQMPTRVRFLVQDIMDMRRNKWHARRIAGKQSEGPKTIQQVREDAYRDGCIYIPQQSNSPQGNKTSPLASMGMLNPLEGSFFGSSGAPPAGAHANKRNSGGGKSGKGGGGRFDGGGGGVRFDDGGTAFLGTGPGAIPSSFDGPPANYNKQQTANGYGREASFSRSSPPYEGGGGGGRNAAAAGNEDGGARNDRQPPQWLPPPPKPPPQRLPLSPQPKRSPPRSTWAGFARRPPRRLETTTSPTSPSPAAAGASTAIASSSPPSPTSSARCSRTR